MPVAVAAYTSPGTPSGFVNDFAGTLSAQEKQQLEQKLSDFSRTSGNEISLVTVKNLGGDTVENYAVTLFHEWGIGKRGKDNGVLILVAIDDRQMRIEVGYGLEQYLTDAQSSWIINNVMKPSFQAGDFYGGIDGAVNEIISVTQGGAVPSEQETSSGLTLDTILRSGGLLFYGSVFLILTLASILGRSKSWWAGGIIGGIIGAGIGVFMGFFYLGIISIAVLIPAGLLFDFLASQSYAKNKALGRIPWWMSGGGRGSGGGFGGFGGGGSGGGGSSGRW